MKKVKKTGKNNSLNTAKRGLAPALLGLLLSAAIFAGCDDLTKEIGEVSRPAVVIDKGGFLKAIEDSEIRDIIVMEGFKINGEVTINSAKTITIAKGETVSIPSLKVNAPLTLNGQDPEAIALKMAASIGGGTQYGILKISSGLTIQSASALELKGEINLLFTAAVMMDDIKVDGLLKVADEALVCKIQIGGEPGTVKLGGSGAVQFGDTEAAPAADTDIELQVVDEPENDLGGGYFDEEEEDEEEAFNDAIVSSLTLKLDSSGALSDLETDDSGKILKLAVNGTAKLAADITYTSGTGAKVTWLSMKPGAVSVDDNGNVTVKGDGSVKITAFAGGKSDTCTVIASMGARLYGVTNYGETNEEETLITISNPTGNTMLEKAFNYIKNDETGTYTAYTIVLDEDDEDEEDDTSNGYTIGANAGSGKSEKTTGTRTGLVIKIMGTKADGAVTITKTGQGALFTVIGQNDEVPHLILENITLKGFESNNKPLIIIGSTASLKGELTMKADSRITENKNSAAVAGVQVKAKSTFTMEGGSIDHNEAVQTSNSTSTNRGGAVYVASGANFTMEGGVIAANKSKSYGAAVYLDYSGSSSGSFSKTGGTIYGKTDDNGNANTTTVSNGRVIARMSSTNAIGKYIDNTIGEEVNCSITTTGGITPSVGIWK
jgi:hypothetical protein